MLIAPDDAWSVEGLHPDHQFAKWRDIDASGSTQKGQALATLSGTASVSAVHGLDGALGSRALMSGIG
jgi:hypothetical protein